MKKVMVFLLVALLLSTFLAASASAGPAYSSIQVLNLGTNNATIAIYYYDQNGNLASLPSPLTNPVFDTVAVGESNTYFPVHAADGFNGSVVIESSEAIDVISNVLYTDPLIQSSWVGFKEGGSTLQFPLIMKGNNSNDTTFNVQNTSADPVDIRISFVPEPGKGYAAIADVVDTLPAFAAHTYDQRTMAAFSGVGQWVGSARVSVETAGGAIAGVAQQIDSARNTGTAYNGFLEGVSTVQMPLVMKDNSNMWTSVNCQNLGPGSTDVTISYTPESGYPALPSETKPGVVENGTAVFFQYGPPKWVGAAQVTNTADNPLACIVNQTNLVSSYASAYEGFDASKASDVVVAPLVQFQPQAGGALWTSINVKNLGTTTSVITLDFMPAPGFSDVPNMTKSVDGGAVGVFFIYDPYGNGDKAIGGAEISSDNANNLALVINQQKANYVGDIYSTYNGFPK